MLPPPPPAYMIDARLDAVNHDVAGHLELVYANRCGVPLGEIYLQLYPNNFRADSDYMRAATTRFNMDTFYPAGRDPGSLGVSDVRVGGRPARCKEQGAYLKIELPQALAPGEVAKVALDFTTHVPQQYDRFGRIGDEYSLGYWYPRVAVRGPGGWDLTPRTTPLQEFHDEHATFDVSLTLPRSFLAGATGHALPVAAVRPGAQGPAPGEHTLHFKARGVRSFCLVAGPAYRELTETRGDLTVHVLVHDDETWFARRIASQTFDMVRFYSRMVGPYPYRDLTIVSSDALPIGGIEMPQLVLNSRPVTRLEDLGRGWVHAGYTALNAHEVAHQWFFGVIGNDEAHDTWIDESFASYLAMRYLERPEAPEGDRTQRLGEGIAWLERLAPFSTQRENQLRAARLQDQAGLAVPLSTPIVDLPLGQIGPTYYARGPVVIEMLRQEMGQEAFDRFLHGLYEHQQFRDATTASVQAEAELAVGRSLEPFFATWVRGAGATLDHRLVRWQQATLPGGRLRTTAWVEQRGSADFPVAVVFRLQNGRELEGHYQPGQPEVSVDSDSPVVGVAIDPGGALLEANATRRGPIRAGILPVPAEDLGLPGGAGGRHGGNAASPLGPGPLAPNLNLDLASIQSAHRGMSLGWQGGQPTWGLGVSQPIYALGTYESRAAASVSRRPEGYAGGVELGLAWQPRVGENPTFGVDVGAERRSYAGDLAGTPGVAVNVARMDALVETRRVLYGVRPAGGRYRIGLEAAPMLLDNPGAFVTPSCELFQHFDLGWCTTLSARVFAATTFGARDPRDGLRLDREGLFRTYGLGAGDSLVATNLEFTRPLTTAFELPGLALPVMLNGLAFADGGWVGAPTWEAGVGVRFGLFGLGQGSYGVDWAPFSADFGWQPLTFQIKGGFGF